MNGVRAAVIFASADKYATAAITLLTTAVVSRMIGPAEFGISVIGAAALAIAGAARELGPVAYIVQCQDLTTSKLRAVTSINTLTTLIMAVALFAAAPLAALLTRTPEVATYIRVAIPAFLTSIVVFPIYGMLSREMRFRSLAMVNIVSTLVNTVALVGFAALHLSYLSFALAQVASAVAGMILLVCARPMFSIFRPTVEGWRHVLSFSLFTSGSALLHRTAQYLTVMILGVWLSPSAVGLLQRSTLICQFPEQTVLAGVNAVALPAFSEQVRRGGDLSESYTAAVARITAFLWPCLGLLVVLAHPLTSLLLGQSWSATAPLVMIIGGALSLKFTSGITLPLIIATGAVRRSFMLAAAQVLITLPIVTIAATFGLEAVAWSSFFVAGLIAIASIGFVHAVAPLKWRELGRALARSLGVTCFALAGPVVVVLASGGAARIDMIGAGVAGALAAGGWLAGLRVFSHPVMEEINRARDKGMTLLRRLRAGPESAEGGASP